MLENRPKTSRRELGLPGIVEFAFGYQRAQALFAANELDIFRMLSSGPRTAEQVASTLGAETCGRQGQAY